MKVRQDYSHVLKLDHKNGYIIMFGGKLQQRVYIIVLEVFGRFKHATMSLALHAQLVCVCIRNRKATPPLIRIIMIFGVFAMLRSGGLIFLESNAHTNTLSLPPRSKFSCFQDLI